MATPRISNKEQIYLFYEHAIDINTKTLYMGHGSDPDVDLDQELAGTIIRGLRILSSIRPDEPINIIMNCQGGEVQHGFAIYDAIRMVSSPVHITVIGHCYSMAAWVLQAATLRRMTRNSSMMIHDGESSLAGSKSAQRNWKKFEETQDRIAVDILLERIQERNPKFSRAKLQNMLDTDTILLPTDALKLGLIDEIV